MEEYNVDMKQHSATNIQNSEIKLMDLILCATISHKNAIIQMYPTLKEKVFTLKEYVEYNQNDKDIDIKDPWGYDINVYRSCAMQIDTCLELLINKIKESKD